MTTIREGKYTVYKLGDDTHVLREEGEHSSLTFARDKFDNEQQFKKTVSDFLFLLLQTGNIARVRQEEDLVIVDYTHDENLDAYGGSQLLFVTGEEAEELGSNYDGRVLEGFLNGKDAKNEKDEDEDERDRETWYL